MGTYGRNVDFRVPPRGGQRGGRYVSPNVVLPQGVPVEVADGATPDAQGRLPVSLATGDTVPKPGMHGIAIYEVDPGVGLGGVDPLLTTYSDRDTIPKNTAIQVVHGDSVKVAFTNTVDRTFLTVRDYEGRIMVAGAGATPTVAVGDYLTPGVGDDDNGYWAETSDATEAWLVVEYVDTARRLVEARFVF